MSKTANKAAWFDPSVPLPPGFGGIPEIRRAIEYMEKELADLVEIYFEQANVFSALVGIYGTRALDSFSNWEKIAIHIRRSRGFLTCVDVAAEGN